MLIPEPLEFDGIDNSNLEASLVKLRQLGFVLEEFGRNFYRLEGCPHWFALGEANIPFYGTFWRSPVKMEVSKSNLLPDRPWRGR